MQFLSSDILILSKLFFQSTPIFNFSINLSIIYYILPLNIKKYFKLGLCSSIKLYQNFELIFKKLLIYLQIEFDENECYYVMCINRKKGRIFENFDTPL